MTISLRRLFLVGGLVALLAAALAPVFAQGWGERGPRTWERPRAYEGDLPYNARPYRGPLSGAEASRHPRCRQLEDQLAGGWTRSTDREQLPKLDAELERLHRDVRRVRAEAERADCYEDMFIFGRSLRRTRTCVDLDRKIEDGQARLNQLRAQREAIVRSADGRGQQDQILAELARYDCGEAYVREYRTRNRAPSFFDLWSDEDSDDDRGSGYPNQTLPYETYRTLCVRLCDGFYFPVSYSTLPSRFAEDEAKCRSQCAAPTELFTHRTADQDAEHAVSLSGRPYTSLPTAFRHRKFYTRGCSCNASEYSREEIAKSEEAFRQRTAATQASKAEPRTSTDAEAAPVPAQPQEYGAADNGGDAPADEAKTAQSGGANTSEPNAKPQ
jgi:hypothetical protein